MVHIRGFGQSDSRALAALMGELGYTTSEQSMSKRMEAIASNSMNATFVAELDDQIVGMIGLRLNNNYEFDDMVVQIVSLVTRTDCRGAGVGSELMRHAEEWAKSHGAGAMSLTSGIKPERLAAHDFYKNKGYDITGYRFTKKL